jgi:hypothetical protein
MSFRNSVIIVASPRSRVGKTLLARLIVDFLTQEDRAVAAFDLNSGGDTLAQFLPGPTAVSAIDGVRDQMALFDRLIVNDGTAKVVDVGHEWFERFFILARQIGFAEEAVMRGIAPAVLFIITPDATSVEAFHALRRDFPQIQLVPVHNGVFGSAQHLGKYRLLGQAASVVELPALAPGLRRHVETPPFSFADEGLAAADLPREIESEVVRWRGRAFREFRELDLRQLITDLQSSIRLPS